MRTPVLFRPRRKRQNGARSEAISDRTPPVRRSLEVFWPYNERKKLSKSCCCCCVSLCWKS
jgi:hypothetical protein